MFSLSSVGGGGPNLRNGVLIRQRIWTGGPNPLGHRNGGMMEWWNGGELRKILNTERRKITQVLKNETVEKLPEILKDRTAETTPNPKNFLRFFSS